MGNLRERADRTLGREIRIQVVFTVRRLVAVLSVVCLTAAAALTIVVVAGGSAETPAQRQAGADVAPSPTDAGSETAETTEPDDGAATPTETDTSTTDSTCTPTTPLVDPAATPEAQCLAATLDRWQADGEYGIGQQLNVSNDTFLDPITALTPDRPALVGFDVQELDQGESYGFAPDPVDSLLELNSEGVLLTASWHALNPATGASSGDRSFQDLSRLLTPTDPVGRRFWQDYDRKLTLLKQLQDGDGGKYPPAAVLFRPLHEANGDWFWWAQGTDPGQYKQLYSALQQRAWDAGVHNIVWGWSANAVNDDRITDPLSILPDKVDVVGIDSYEQVGGTAQQAAELNLDGLSELAGRVPRVAVTEAGPHGSKDGNWDPTVIARSAAADGVRMAYTMMWFDDGNGDDGYSGKKQISSLLQGSLWLADCPDGVCQLA